MDDDADPDRYKSLNHYDANGNIARTERWSSEGVQYDDMTYRYRGYPLRAFHLPRTAARLPGPVYPRPRSTSL